MKKICIIFLLSIIITITAFGFPQSGAAVQKEFCGEFLRIHIRADSNENAAQSVKYAVRDEVVAYLTPVVAECEDKEEAIKRIQTLLLEIATVAEQTLQSKGFSYGARAKITQETFPTRVYEAYTLPAGEYTALIIELGEGKGDNWWCVVYPPLCFVAQANQTIVYKSKIMEMIESWKNR